MKDEEVTRLEAAIRSANDYPSVEVVAESDELERVDALVRLETGSGSVRSVHGRDIMQTQQRPPRQRRPRKRSGWAVAGFAFSVVLVIGLGLALVGAPFGEDGPVVADQPTETESTSSSTVAESTATVTTAPVVEPAGPTWQQVGVEATDVVVGLSDITAIGSGFVAAGFNPGTDLREDGVILMSQDGVSWVRVGETDPALTTGTALIEAVVEGDPGLIAVGRSCQDSSFPCDSGPFPTVWTSIDGSSWIRTPVSDQLGDIMDVVVSGNRLIAAGSVTEFDEDGVPWTRPTVWTSSDGVDWSRSWQGVAARNEEYPPSRGVIGGLAEDPDGLLIAFGKAENSAGNAVVAVWSSIDGEIWERIGADSAAFVTETGVIPLDASWGPTGFVIVGSEVADEDFDVAAWNSPDGRNWTRIDVIVQDVDTTGSFSSIVGTESGFTATGPYGFGLGEGPVSVWTSNDGQIWDHAGVVAEGYSQAMIVTDTGTLIAGAHLDGEDFIAAIWLSPTLDPISPSGGN